METGCIFWNENLLDELIDCHYGGLRFERYVCSNIRKSNTVSLCLKWCVNFLLFLANVTCMRREIKTTYFSSCDCLSTVHCNGFMRIETASKQITLHANNCKCFTGHTFFRLHIYYFIVSVTGVLSSHVLQSVFVMMMRVISLDLRVCITATCDSSFSKYFEFTQK